MQVLSSLSGLPFSAASAGFAPTNSADVSAIASAYQVVSSTATQLHAGTAYLTSVNGAPISASRAGQAANASLATSAYYDGTGRLISALPDSAAVSAIASSYAESAASGKQDAIEFGYDANNLISSIDGSALAGGGGGATGDYVEKSATNVAIGTDVSASGISFAQGSGTIASADSIAIGWGSRASSNSVALGNLNNAMSGSLVQGYRAYAYYSSMAQGDQTHATKNSFAQGTFTEAHDGSMAQGYFALASGNSFAQGIMASAKKSSVALGRAVYASGNSFAYGIGASAINSATIFGTNNQSGDGSGASGAAFVIGDGTASDARHDLMVVTKDGEITMFSGTADTVGTGIMSSIRAISAAATGGGGGVDSATVSAIASAYVESGVSSKLDTTAFNSGDFYSTGNPSGFVDSAYVDSAVSGKMDSSASSSFYTTANESGFITGVDLTDYATTAYVDSAVSGKMDASAIDYTRTGGGTQIYASGNGSSTNQFSAKNDSAGAAIIAGENARLRLWDTAATANLYASSIGGWNAAANLVSSQSANWGGSALQLSAGAGISLTMSGNILIIATASA